MSRDRNVLVKRGCVKMDSEAFINGYQAGHLSYMLESRLTACTEETLLDLLSTRLNNSAPGMRYNAGYIVGWITTLLTQDAVGKSQEHQG